MRTSRFFALSFTGLWVVFGALTAAASSEGPSRDPHGEGRIRFSNPELSMSGSLGGCGPSCLYTKANDVLTLQTAYMRNLAGRMIELREELNAAGMDSQRRENLERTLRNHLKPYCIGQRIKLGEGWDRTSDRCLGNYLQVVARALEVNRNILLKNYRTIVDLAEGPGALPGKEGLKNPSNTDKILKDRALLKDPKWRLYPDFPFHPAFEAIDPVVKRLGETARHQIRERGAMYSGRSEQEKSAADEALAAWWNGFPRCPSKDEYTKVEFVERYPGKQTGEKLPVIVTDRKTGKIVHDLAAFQAAQKKCSEEQKQAFREIPIPPEVLREAGSPGSLSESRKAFEDAQQAMVNAIEAKAKESKESKEYTVSIFGDGKSKGAGAAAAAGAEIDADIAAIRSYAAGILGGAGRRK